jgi:uncharacterized protein YdhG (YjbR/CyaY superfamily)
MSVIDVYLRKVEPAKRSQLLRIRTLAKDIVRSAEEHVVYGMPTLKYRGKPFLGFDAHKNHIGIYPYSAQVIKTLKDELHGYGLSSGAIRVPFDKQISKGVLKRVIECRLKAIKAQLAVRTPSRKLRRR